MNKSKNLQKRTNQLNHENKEPSLNKWAIQRTKHIIRSQKWKVQSEGAKPNNNIECINGIKIEQK